MPTILSENILLRLQEVVEEEEEEAGVSIDRRHQFILGEYSEEVAECMKSKLKDHIKRLDDVLGTLRTLKDVRHGTEDMQYFCLVQRALDLIQPDNSIRCFFILHKVNGIQWVLHGFGNILHGLFWVLWWISSSCRQPLRYMLWVIIASIYIAGIHFLDEISEHYILKNPNDAHALAYVDFQVNSVNNCSLAPVDQPLLLRYSHKFLTSYGIVAYGLTIGLIIRSISEQQAGLYDWVSLDDLLDQDRAKQESAVKLVMRGNKKLTSDVCQAIHMDMLSKKCQILLFDAESMGLDQAVHDGSTVQDSNNCFGIF